MALYIVVHLEGQERGIEYNGVVDSVFSFPGVHGMEKAGVDEKKISCFSRVFTVFYGDGKFPSFNHQDLKFRMPVVGYADLGFVLVFQIEMEPVGFQRVQISAPSVCSLYCVLVRCILSPLKSGNFTISYRKNERQRIFNDTIIQLYFEKHKKNIQRK